MEYGLNGGQGALKRGYRGMASSAARVRSTATRVGWHPGIITKKESPKAIIALGLSVLGALRELVRAERCEAARSFNHT